MSSSTPAYLSGEVVACRQSPSTIEAEQSRQTIQSLLFSSITTQKAIKSTIPSRYPTSSPQSEHVVSITCSGLTVPALSAPPMSVAVSSTWTSNERITIAYSERTPLIWRALAVSYQSLLGRPLPTNWSGSENPSVRMLGSLVSVQDPR